MSLRSFAKEIGRDPGAVSRLETGKSQPTAKTLFAIASVLKVDVAVITQPVEDAA